DDQLSQRLGLAERRRGHSPGSEVAALDMLSGNDLNVFMPFIEMQMQHEDIERAGRAFQKLHERAVLKGQGAADAVSGVQISRDMDDIGKRRRLFVRRKS